MTVTPRYAISENAKPFSGLAFSVLEPIAEQLFQLRKVGITVHIPDVIRQDMLASHGDAAARFLSLVDGWVVL